jgi:hypothetical protein
MSNRIEPRVFRDGNSEEAKAHAEYIKQTYGSVVYRASLDGKGIMISPGDPPRCPTCGAVRWPRG